MVDSCQRTDVGILIAGASTTVRSGQSEVIVRLQRQESRVTPRWTCAPGITTSTAVAPVARLESSASAVLEESGSPLSYEVSRPLAVLDGPSGPVSSPALDQAPTCREASHLAPSLRPEAASEAS